jgi:acyl-coenzyme A synthetase/AMP-(fatty) acid ligase
MHAMQTVNLYFRTAYLAQYQRSKIAIETAKARLTYGQLDQLARRISSLLRASGVVRGDVVGQRLNDTPAHVAAFLAVMRIGAIVLPLDFRGTRPEFDRVVGQFGPKAVLSDDKAVLDWSRLTKDIVGSDSLPPDDGPVEEAPGGVFAYSLTSGTTGQPKAMVTTHEQIFARCTTRALEGMFARNDRFLTTLPLAYLAGREHAINPLLLGATLVMFPTLFEPKELIATVNSRDITAFNLSPNMSRAVLALPRPDGQMLMPNVRVMVSTTGKLDREERAALRQYVVPEVIDYYGSTGTGPMGWSARRRMAPKRARWVALRSASMRKSSTRPATWYRRERSARSGFAAAP